MKRSNIIFFTLISVLFTVPFLLVGIFYLASDNEELVSLGKYYKVIVIDNPELAAGDVKIEFVKNKKSQRFRTDLKTSMGYYTSIYYKGKRKHLPAFKVEKDTLFVGKPEESPQDGKLILEIKSDHVEQVILNNQTIRGKTKEDLNGEYTYVPGLTGKIDRFIEICKSQH